MRDTESGGVLAPVHQKIDVVAIEPGEVFEKGELGFVLAEFGSLIVHESGGCAVFSLGSGIGASAAKQGGEGGVALKGGDRVAVAEAGRERLGVDRLGLGLVVPGIGDGAGLDLLGQQSSRTLSLARQRNALSVQILGGS